MIAPSAEQQEALDRLRTEVAIYNSHALEPEQFAADIALALTLLDTLSRELERMTNENQELLARSGKSDVLPAQQHAAANVEGSERRRTAENLYEAIGGDLCICQRSEVSHWCEGCQRRLQLIREALRQ